MFVTFEKSDDLYVHTGYVYRHWNGVDFGAVGMRRRPCGDCGMFLPPLFAVKDEVWLTVADRKDLLCWRCTEKRLGRQLTYSDLKPKAGLTKEMVFWFGVFFEMGLDERTKALAAYHDQVEV